jgi:hypothetical protein
VTFVVPLIIHIEIAPYEVAPRLMTYLQLAGLDRGQRDWTSDTAEDKFDVEAEARLRGVQPYQVRAAGAVNDRLMADIVNDFRRPRPQSASMIPDKQRSEDAPHRASGGTAPLRQQPGIDIIDRMCDAQDRADRAAAIRQQVETEWIESHFDKGPRVERSYNPVRRFDSEVPGFHREKK